MLLINKLRHLNVDCEDVSKERFISYLGKESPVSGLKAFRIRVLCLNKLKREGMKEAWNGL